MNEYLQIVTRWYDELRVPFATFIGKRFTGFSSSEVEDLYQDTFLAIHDNLTQGRVAAETNWKAYILRIGLNQAINLSKSLKHIVALDSDPDEDGKDSPSNQFDRFPALQTLVAETTDDPAEQEQRIAVLNEKIDHLGEPCRSLLLDFYYNNLSLAEIRDELGYENTNVAKTKRYKCFDRLKKAVMAAMAF